MPKAFWVGFLTALLLVFLSSLSQIMQVVTIVFVLIFAFLLYNSAWWFAKKDYEYRIETLLIHKGRAKQHMRLYNDAYDRLKKQKRIVLFSDILTDIERAKYEKKPNNGNNQ